MLPAPRLLPASLIITTRNRSGLLHDTIESLFAGDVVPRELILVDQSDMPDPTLLNVCHRDGCEIRYVHSQTRGISAARNCGIQISTSEILVFTDDDMYMDRAWLETLISAQLKDGPMTVVTGRVLPVPAPGKFVPAVVERETAAVYSGRLAGDVLASGNMAAYRSLLRDIGGYDERLGAGSHFPAAEDNDLGYRLLSSGVRVRYVPEAILYHRAWRANVMYPVIRWRYGRGKGGLYAKHSSVHDPYMLKRMLRDIGRRLVSFPLRLFTHPARACGDVSYCCGIIIAYTSWMLLFRLFKPEQNQQRCEMYNDYKDTNRGSPT